MNTQEDLYKLYDRGVITEHELLNRFVDIGATEVRDEFKEEFARIVEMRKQPNVIRFSICSVAPNQNLGKKD